VCVCVCVCVCVRACVRACVRVLSIDCGMSKLCCGVVVPVLLCMCCD